MKLPAVRDVGVEKTRRPESAQPCDAPGRSGEKREGKEDPTYISAVEGRRGVVVETCPLPRTKTWHHVFRGPSRWDSPMPPPHRGG